MEKKFKKTVTVKETSKFWGIVKDVKGGVTKEYFRNGETHFEGVWLTGKSKDKKFDLPTVFFNF